MIGSTVAEGPPRACDWRKISAAKPAQFVAPALLKWKVPDRSFRIFDEPHCDHHQRGREIGCAGRDCRLGHRRRARLRAPSQCAASSSRNCGHAPTRPRRCARSRGARHSLARPARRPAWTRHRRRAGRPVIDLPCVSTVAGEDIVGRHLHERDAGRSTGSSPSAAGASALTVQAATWSLSALSTAV